MWCICVTFGMLFWLIFQPGSVDFIAIRVAIGFTAIVLAYFAVTWHQKGGWKTTGLVLLVVLGLGSFAHFAFNLGIINYPKVTFVSMVVLIILYLLYIKYVEPKVLRKSTN